VRFAVFTLIQDTASKKIHVTDDELSTALEHLYRKATIEAKWFNSVHMLKISIEEDGIHYYRSRLLVDQQVRTVGRMDEYVKLEGLTGINFWVPIIDRYFSLAMSIGLHLHYSVFPHSEPEALLRLSNTHVMILGGCQLLKKIASDCIKCKKDQKKIIKQLMGPLADPCRCLEYLQTCKHVWRHWRRLEALEGGGGRSPI